MGADTAPDPHRKVGVAERLLQEDQRAGVATPAARLGTGDEQPVDARVHGRGDLVAADDLGDDAVGHLVPALDGGPLRGDGPGQDGRVDLCPGGGHQGVGGRVVDGGHPDAELPAEPRQAALEHGRDPLGRVQLDHPKSAPPGYGYDKIWIDHPKWLQSPYPVVASNMWHFCPPFTSMPSVHYVPRRR